MCVCRHLHWIIYWDYSRYVILVSSWWTEYSVNKYNIIFLICRRAVDFSIFFLTWSAPNSENLMIIFNFSFLTAFVSFQNNIINYDHMFYCLFSLTINLQLMLKINIKIRASSYYFIPRLCFILLNDFQLSAYTEMNLDFLPVVIDKFLSIKPCCISRMNLTW